MYPVNSTFHTLSTQDAPKTRVRIYFITDAIDCTDDDEVQTSGTLLVGAVGDTDSNGRIGQDGITFTEMFNPEKNIQIGTAVSYQIGMTLLNTDGALNGFNYGRCKVYLDVYDAANSAWRVCPMGVFVIDIPTKRRAQLVAATGYDQMQRFDTICDSWWNGLNWSGGLTLLQILNSMAAQRGVFVSANTASALVNSSVTYTEPPFSCVEVTYREVLEYIAEATGTIARFDRDGYLDLRFFSAAKISGSTVTINADTVGNTCLDIDIAEYQAAAVDLLKVKIAEDDIGVTVGRGTNQYTIVNNLFLYGSTATIITNRATPIYNRLNGLGAYTPIQAKLIYDWSLEAGDIINIVRDSTTYPVLIFQQTLAWRGGYVTADILADGDSMRPVMDYNERASYRMASEMSQKVGDNEIISKINQTAESIQIQASRVDLAGYVTFTNLSTSGQTTINGGNITTGELSADRIRGGTLKVGGVNNANGVLSIYGSDGIRYGEISKDGIILYDAPNRPNNISLILSSILSGYDNYQTERMRLDYMGGIISLNDANGTICATIMGDNGYIGLKDGTRNRFSVQALNGQTRWYDENGNLRIYFDSTSTSDYAEFSSEIRANDVTINGVLDVTNRRASSTLSSAGWYRIIQYTASNNNNAYGAHSFITDIKLTRATSNSYNELHEVKLTGVYQNLSFTDEISKTRTQNFTKIRCTRKDNVLSVDVYYSAAVSNLVYVDFDVAIRPDYKALWLPMNFIAVADSPSGETVLTTYNFTSNTNEDESATKDANFSASTFTLTGYRRGDVIIYRWNISVPALTAATYYNMGTFSKILPPAQMSVTWAGQGTGQYLIDFRTSGLVTIFSGSATSAQFCRGVVTFPT